MPNLLHLTLVRDDVVLLGLLQSQLTAFALSLVPGIAVPLVNSNGKLVLEPKGLRKPASSSRCLLKVRRVFWRRFQQVLVDLLAGLRRLPGGKGRACPAAGVPASRAAGVPATALRWLRLRPGAAGVPALPGAAGVPAEPSGGGTRLPSGGCARLLPWICATKLRYHVRSSAS